MVCLTWQLLFCIFIRQCQAMLEQVCVNHKCCKHNTSIWASKIPTLAVLHLINSGITIIFNNCIVYLENLPQSLNKLVWKPPRGLTSKILPQITIKSAPMSPVIDICISHTKILLLIVFPVIWLLLCSLFASQVTKLSTQLGNPGLVWEVLPSTRGNTKYLSTNLIASHFSWLFRFRSKWYWVVSWILWRQCLSPRVQWLKLCLAGGSYVAFLQGAGNPYSAAGMCLAS